MDANNNWRDAWERLIADASKRVRNPIDNNFMVIALGDADEVYANNALNAININNPDWSPRPATKDPAAKTHYVFWGRILGENSPHAALYPMPCFDYVREIAGWFQTAPSARKTALDVAKTYNQNLVLYHTQFYIPKNQGKKPRLGDIFSARLIAGSDWEIYSLTVGTASKLESKDFFRVENWEKDVGNNQKFYYTTTKKSCDSLEDLFEEKAIESEQIEECGELCCIEADDWHTFENPNHHFWTKLGPNAGNNRLKAKPCEGYVVKRPATYDQQFNKLTDIVKKEIDWWACGDVKKAWGSKMDEPTKEEFNKTDSTKTPQGGWYTADQIGKCDYRTYKNEAQYITAFSRGDTDSIDLPDMYALPGATMVMTQDVVDTLHNMSGIAALAGANLIPTYLEPAGTDLAGNPNARGVDESGTGEKEIQKIAEYFARSWRKGAGYDHSDPIGWVKTDAPWSAVTISWLMLQVDDDFPSGIGHWQYVFRSHGLDPNKDFVSKSTLKGGWTAWLRGAKTPRIVAQLGDILVKPRGKSSKTNSHGDVVSRIALDGNDTYAYLAGGNISNTMYGWLKRSHNAERIKLNKVGGDLMYPPASGASDYQIVLKKDGRIVPAEKEEVFVAAATGGGPVRTEL